MKAPAFQFYPGDWMKDPELRSISVTARGVWIDLLCLMSESSRRGYLQNRLGKPYSTEQLSRMIGLDNQNLEACLTELLDGGVMSVEQESGVFFSRRMVRDEQLSEIRREAGKLGGNPALLKQKSTTRLNQIPTPSSSSSSSSSDTPPTPSVNGNAPSTGTEGWEDLTVEAVKAGMVFDPDPAADLCQKTWRWLDMGEKMAAVQGIAPRIENGQYGEPRYTPSLRSYLEKKLWRETLRPRDTPRLIPQQEPTKLRPKTLAEML